jgi:hypothetical protein
MNRKTIISVVTIFGLTVFGYIVLRSRIAPATAHEFDQANWPARCQALKQEFSQQPQLSLTYQPRPEKVNIQSSWSLNWFEQRVPIPAISYSDVSILKTSDQSYVVLMVGQIQGQPVKILLGRHEDTPAMEDVFATESDPSNETETISEQGKALTQQLFGGAVEISKITDLGYRHTPAALSCAGERWQEEAPIAIALILKGVGIEEQASAVYEMERGQVIQSQRDEQDLWVARWDEGDFISDVTWRLPKVHTYGVMGLGVGQENWQAAPSQPQWLTALETALAQPDRNNWQSLAAALKQAGMSEKSVKSVQVIVEKTAQ